MFCFIHENMIELCLLKDLFKVITILMSIRDLYKSNVRHHGVGVKRGRGVAWGRAREGRGLW